MHLQEAYASPRYKAGDFPHSEKAATEVLSLPMYPELTRPMQDEVVAALAGCRGCFRPELRKVGSRRSSKTWSVIVIITL